MERFKDMLTTLIGDAFRLGQRYRWYAMPELEESKQALIDYVARLHARQITPEMEAAFRGLKAKMFGADTPDLVSILMGEFADLMVLMEAAIDPETGEG